MSGLADRLKDSLNIDGERVVTAAGAITMGNEGSLVVKKTVGAASAVTLPRNPRPGTFRWIKDGKGDAATNNITITGYNAATIDGATSYIIGSNYGAVLLKWNGTEWNVMGSGGVASNAEIVTTTNVILAAESGRTYYLSLAGGFTTTLPAPALGLNFRFIVKTAPTGAPYVITPGSAILYGMMEERAGGAGVAGAAGTNFNFIHNQSKIADWSQFFSDGTNWYFHGMVDVAAGVTIT